MLSLKRHLEREFDRAVVVRKTGDTRLVSIDGHGLFRLTRCERKVDGAIAISEFVGRIRDLRNQPTTSMRARKDNLPIGSAYPKVNACD